MLRYCVLTDPFIKTALPVMEDLPAGNPSDEQTCCSLIQVSLYATILIYSYSHDLTHVSGFKKIIAQIRAILLRKITVFLVAGLEQSVPCIPSNVPAYRHYGICGYLRSRQSVYWQRPSRFPAYWSVCIQM